MLIEKPINKLIAEYISEMDVKPYVQVNTRWVLDRFVKWMVVQRINVKQPRRADIIHYKNTLITEGKTPTTVDRYLSPIKTFFTWMESNGYYTNIAAGIKSPKDNRRFRKEYLQPDQVVQLLQSIPTDTITGKRNLAMITLMVYNGLRRIEIIRLTIADMVSSNELMIQRKGRTYKESIRIQPEVYDIIEQYLIERGSYLPGDPLFANHSHWHTNTISETILSKIVKKYLKQLSDSKKLTCHSLRHTAAITLLKSGKSVYDVQHFLGHTNTHSTEAYLKAIEAEQRQNNTLSRDLIDSLNQSKKTPNMELFTA